MGKVDKLAKYVRNPSKANKIAKQIKKLQKKLTKSQHVGIKKYKKRLQGHMSKNTRYLINKSKKSQEKSQERQVTSLLESRKSQRSIKNTDSDKLFSRKSTTIKINNIPNIPNIPDVQQIKKMSTIDKTKSPNDYEHEHEYVIAIPSYKRSDIIQTHTLAVLNRHKIKPEFITIFVANQEEYDIYKSTLPSFLYNNIVIGQLGLKNQRNFISEYYPGGKYIVEMDDDIKSIMQLVVKRKNESMKIRQKSQKSTTTIKKTVKPIEDLDAFIRRAFEMCTESNIFLWGVYPLVNPHFMTYKITTDLRFIVGPMWGMINRHRKDLQLTVDEKENSERTLQFWTADGAVLRFNNVGIETKYYKNKGGMQDEGKNRKEEALKSVYYLNKMYPNLTKISLKKKSGMPEIKMIHKKKK